MNPRIKTFRASSINACEPKDDDNDDNDDGSRGDVGSYLYT